MTAKKTFGSIRVRGPAIFDSAFRVQGKNVNTVREYSCLLSFDLNHNETEVIKFAGHFGTLNWQRENLGGWFALLPEQLDELKWFPQTIGQFMDGDGDTINARLSIAPDLASGHSRLNLNFTTAAGLPKDPFDFAIYLHFRYYG